LESRGLALQNHFLQLKAVEGIKCRKFVSFIYTPENTGTLSSDSPEIGHLLRELTTYSTNQNQFMGKSQETWSKKETEKKKQIKKKDKEQKKEERRANAKEGASLEDMMAYVDENGNISSVPPDPRKKRTIKEEDIAIGVAKQEALPPAADRRGTVTFFNDSKGYGFIKDQDSQESIFVHLNGLVDAIRENDKVTFQVEMGMKGLNAIGVKVVK
jgi:cold shock CspA family protein